MDRSSGLRISTDRIWFGLLMIYIVSGYFAQDVLLPALVNSILLYLFLAYSMFIIFISRQIRLTGIIVWELIFLVLSFVAMLYSPSFSVFGGTYYSLLVNFVIVFVLSQMPWNAARFDMLMKTFTFSSVGLIALLAITGNLNDSTGRLGADAVGNANILAMMLMVSAIYTIWLFVSTNTRFQKILYLISLVIIYIGMFLSGGRKYIVIPIIFAYVLLLHKTDKKGRKHIVAYTAAIVVMTVILYQVIMKVPFFYNTIGYRFEGFFALFDDQYTVDSSTLKRTRMIEIGFKKWLESPLWGYGFDSFKYYNASSVTGYMYYSHNNFVELLYNQGIIGFCAYYGFYFYLLFSLRKQKTMLRKGFAVGVILALLAFEYYGVSYSELPAQIMLCLAYMKCKIND